MLSSRWFRSCAPLITNQLRNAGHAKWQNIRSTKLAGDNAKAKLFSRYVLMVRKAITMNKYQTDPKINKALADVLSEAQKFNVPKATLDRAIERSANVKIKNINFECKGKSGYALIIRCETDNISFVRKDIKKVMKKYEVEICQNDTMINLFRTEGYIRCACKDAQGNEVTLDRAEEAAIETNAQEVVLEENDTTDEELSKLWVFTTDAQSLDPCRTALEKYNLKVLNYSLDLVPYTTIDFGPKVYEEVSTIEAGLKEIEQVVDVYHNVAEPCNET